MTNFLHWCCWSCLWIGTLFSAFFFFFFPPTCFLRFYSVFGREASSKSYSKQWDSLWCQWIHCTVSHSAPPDLSIWSQHCGSCMTMKKWRGCEKYFIGGVNMRSFIRMCFAQYNIFFICLKIFYSQILASLTYTVVTLALTINWFWAVRWVPKMMSTELFSPHKE